MQHYATRYVDSIFDCIRGVRVRAAYISQAVALASSATLNDSSTADAYRMLYQTSTAIKKPSVHACDGATSDVYYHGTILSDGFEAFMTLMTNGSR